MPCEAARQGDLHPAGSLRALEQVSPSPELRVCRVQSESGGDLSGLFLLFLGVSPVWQRTARLALGILLHPQPLQAATSRGRSCRRLTPAAFLSIFCQARVSGQEGPPFSVPPRLLWSLAFPHCPSPPHVLRLAVWKIPGIQVLWAGHFAFLCLCFPMSKLRCVR